MTRAAKLNLTSVLFALAALAALVLSDMIALQYALMTADQEVLLELPVEELVQIRVLG